MDFDKKLYDISFKITCVNPESRLHSLFYALPVLEEMTFSFKGMSDEKWLCKLHNLHSLGIEAIELTKTPLQVSETDGLVETLVEGLNCFMQAISTEDDKESEAARKELVKNLSVFVKGVQTK